MFFFIPLCYLIIRTSSYPLAVLLSSCETEHLTQCQNLSAPLISLSHCACVHARAPRDLAAETATVVYQIVRRH